MMNLDEASRFAGKELAVRFYSTLAEGSPDHARAFAKCGIGEDGELLIELFHDINLSLLSGGMSTDADSSTSLRLLGAAWAFSAMADILSAIRNGRAEQEPRAMLVD